jgi:ATP-dependent RNA helicase TDRD9
MNYLLWDEIQLCVAEFIYVTIYLQINILRAAINKLVCDGPNGLKYLGPERIVQLQDNARQKLLG